MSRADMDPGLRGAISRYRVMAYIVGTLLLVLVLVGVPLQLAAGNPKVVNLVGPIHGILYIGYLVAAADMLRRWHFRLGQIVAIAIAGFVPFLTFYVEHVTTRRIEREVAAAANDLRQ